jgi:hypothetical protein
MDIEVLHIDDCPNWEETGRRLREALDSTGHAEETIGFRMLRTPADVSGTAFAGSPTVTLDGVDLIPSPGATNDLACRVYATPTGLAGSPTVDQLIAAIRAHEPIA